MSSSELTSCTESFSWDASCSARAFGPSKVQTIFGYVVHGQDSASGQPQRSSFYCHRVQQMWELDSLGISPETETVRKKYPEPVWNPQEKKYEMGLLWSSEKRPTSNRVACGLRTNRMAQKLDPAGQREYNEHILKLQRDAVVEPAPSSGNPEDAFFLPHRGLHRNNKLRVVFDGSAKDGVGISLNDYLEPGENLLHRLVSVFLRFRAYPIACQADIKAAFHQISVKEDDRMYLQFLWQGQTMRFRRVPFGLTCSPFMLLASIKKHLLQYHLTHPELCTKLESGLYMDDIAVGFQSVDEAQEQMDLVEHIFQEAGMETHKSRVTGVPSEKAKILGLEWSTEADSLAVNIPEAAPPVTKSQLLSVIAKPFDPFGMLSPWVIEGKVIFQQTWSEPSCPTWDSELPPEMKDRAQKWWKQSEDLNEVNIPRSIGWLREDTRFHVFCDASSKAYCTVVYAVHGGESRFVLAKARLAPLKPSLTIPRLELMAALIGMRLMCFIKETLSVSGPQVHYWTDSMDVLCWIRSKKPLKAFVGNRVSAILEDTTAEQWSHVTTDQNPADLGTRGISLRSLSKKEEWWRGPPFLLQASPVPALPEDGFQVSENAKMEFKGTTPVRCHTAVIDAEADPTPLPAPVPFQLEDCSALKKAVNRTAWLFRFINNARATKENRISGPLQPSERQKALHFWIRSAQQTAYSQEILDLTAQRLISDKSPLAKLRPHLDENDVLRATPRTGEPPIIILPDSHRITDLIIDHAHRLSFHQGVRSTQAALSAEYLVRRRAVRRIVQACTRCRRYKALPYQQSEGALPEFRTFLSRSFEKVGIDYFGPLYIKNGSKVWGLLITCATTRALHLEVVRSQSTEDLQGALRRFLALRGHPSLIYSDNAKSFRKILGILPPGVKWRYIPEASPWWGGFWERLVGCVKAAMRITLHQCHLTHEELIIVFYELAMHLNLRPLTEDVQDGLLTPAHFLFGVTHIQGVISPAVDPTATLDRAWRNRKRVAEQLVKRWTNEYLQSLRAWNTRRRGCLRRTPSVGEIVLVHGEGSRGRWPLGRVEALIPGRDGVVRAVQIKLREKLTRRPVTKLYRLEARTDNEFETTTVNTQLTIQS